LASAAAAYLRLRRAAGGRVTPGRVRARSVRELREAGLTRQKAAYVRDLAIRVESGALDLAALAGASDRAARRALLELRGVGPWTADIYLLMALRRPDVWPDGDLALAQAARQVKGLRETPGRDRLRRLAGRWRPWRAVAARVLWHHYLAERRR
ncbi:MAG: DNA-3-methyladenine glycosylase 2 family protein, partial [Thermoanaerobaculia bacterium]|nr:DNA-3-methyladenine glycosylase 2 family protein [Thermoanaerobaculia bacterium]